MCDLALFTVGMQAVGGVTSAVGAYNTSKANQATFEYNQGIYGNLAADAETRGTQAAVRHRMATKSLKGKQIAAFASRGIALDEGTALDVLASTDILSAMDEQTILDNAAREAYGYKSKASLQGFAAAGESPGLAAATSLLGSAGSVASSWYKLSSAGAI